MLVLVTYDVSTTSPEGRKRLRQVCRLCVSYGQRVQNSVFECVVDPTQWTRFKLRLLAVYKPEEDSLRFYFMGSNWRHRVEHHGAKPSIDFEGTIIA